MSFTRDAGKIVYQCDHCHEELETEEREFEDARNIALDAGWVTLKLKHTWYNFDSSKCREDFLAERARAQSKRGQQTS